MLRHLSRKPLPYLTPLFNHLLQLGFFHNSWKRAKVIPIPKPNQPPTDPNSYRPISLLNIVGKLFERIIASRLRTCVSQQHLLPHEQFGFRKKKNTQPYFNLFGSQIIFPMATIFTNTPAWSHLIWGKPMTQSGFTDSCIN